VVNPYNGDGQKPQELYNTSHRIIQGFGKTGRNSYSGKKEDG
jgi:hypothetical protein